MQNVLTTTVWWGHYWGKGRATEHDGSIAFVVAYLTPWSLGVTAVLFYTLTTLIDRDSSAETPSTNSFNEEIVLKRLKYFIDTSQISFGRELDDFVLMIVDIMISANGKYNAVVMESDMIFLRLGDCGSFCGCFLWSRFSTTAAAISKIEITAAFIGDEPKTIHVIKTTIGRDKIDTPFDILFSSAALPNFSWKKL